MPSVRTRIAFAGLHNICGTLLSTASIEWSVFIRSLNFAVRLLFLRSRYGLLIYLQNTIMLLYMNALSERVGYKKHTTCCKGIAQDGASYLLTWWAITHSSNHVLLLSSQKRNNNKSSTSFWDVVFILITYFSRRRVFFCARTSFSDLSTTRSSWWRWTCNTPAQCASTSLHGSREKSAFGQLATFAALPHLRDKQADSSVTFK